MISTSTFSSDSYSLCCSLADHFVLSRCPSCGPPCPPWRRLPSPSIEQNRCCCLPACLPATPLLHRISRVNLIVYWSQSNCSALPCYLRWTGGIASWSCVTPLSRSHLGREGSRCICRVPRVQVGFEHVYIRSIVVNVCPINCIVPELCLLTTRVSRNDFITVCYIANMRRVPLFPASRMTVQQSRCRPSLQEVRAYITQYSHPTHSLDRTYVHVFAFLQSDTCQ